MLKDNIIGVGVIHCITLFYFPYIVLFSYLLYYVSSVMNHGGKTIGYYSNPFVVMKNILCKGETWSPNQQAVISLWFFFLAYTFLFNNVGVVCRFKV